MDNFHHITCSYSGISYAIIHSFHLYKEIIKTQLFKGQITLNGLNAIKQKIVNKTCCIILGIKIYPVILRNSSFEQSGAGEQETMLIQQLHSKQLFSSEQYFKNWSNLLWCFWYKEFNHTVIYYLSRWCSQNVNLFETHVMCNINCIFPCNYWQIIKMSLWSHSKQWLESSKCCQN